MSRPLQILLVEDEQDHVELMRRAFERESAVYQLVVEPSLRTAIQRLQSLEPDLLIADFLLPDGRGTELLQKDRSKASYPVLILTSHGSEKIAVEAMKAGALDYVVKTENTLSEMPSIARRVLREWSHIVDRKRAEERASRLAIILEETVNEVYICQAEGLEVLLANRRARENLGYNQKEISDLRAMDFVHGISEESLRERVACLKSEGTRTVFVQASHRRKDGSIYPVEAHVQALVLDGVPVFVVFVIDVSERIEAEKERRSLERQLETRRRLETIGALAGGIAHDFKNLLSPILSFGELALRDLEPKSKPYFAIDRQLRAVRRAQELVQQILIFSRQTEPERNPVAIGPAVLETLDLVESTLPEGISLRREIDLEEGILLADPAELHRVLTNLCSNGIHAMSNGGGCLTVSLTSTPPDAATGKPSRTALLRVSDEGHGMNASTLERIFDPFFTTKGMMEGTGLGLSVVYGIVRSWEGEIEVDSAPDAGSRFSVTLPLLESDPPR